MAPKKATQKKVEKPASVVHMRVNNPITLRKDVLGTTISTTEILRAYEEILTLREQKAKYMKQLKTLLNSIKREVRALNLSELPLTEMGMKEVEDKYMPEPKVKPKPVVKKAPVIKPRPKPVVKKPTTKADKLDVDIADLKKKLASL